MIRTLLLLLLVLVACQGPRLRPVDPSSTGMATATGTVESISTLAGEDWRIVLVPEAGSAGLLADGQQRLPCELPRSYDRYRGRFEAVLSELRVGSRVEVAGYHVADDGEGGIHKIRPWTSVDPHP